MGSHFLGAKYPNPVSFPGANFFGKLTPNFLLILVISFPPEIFKRVPPLNGCQRFGAIFVDP